MATAYLSPGVYVEEVSAGPKPIEGVGTAVAAFIGFAESGPVGQPTLVTNWTQFTRAFGGPVGGGYLAQSVYGYFNNGGTIAYISRLPGEVSNRHATDGPQRSLPRAALPSRGQSALPSLEFTALESAAGAGEIHVEVRPAEGEGAADDQFTISVRHGGAEETFPNVTLSKSRGARNVVEVVNRESKLVRVAERESAGTLAERAPAAGSYTLSRAQAGALAMSTEPTLPEVGQGDFVGDAAARSGILGLEALDTVTMVCLPDLMAAYQARRITEETVRVVQTAVLDHCANMKDRVAILDCPPDMSPQQIGDWRQKTAGYDSKYGALYYPWIQVASPDGGTMLLPPSGHMAGVWARTDSERGVHKAPANEVVRGAVGLQIQVSRNEQDTLNPIGVNCIRAFPGRGIRAWGARTLSSDPEWRYINVRRLFNFVEKSIENGTQWVVFEPNDQDLWLRVRRDVGSFLTRVWASGALFGATTAEAFFVKCDAELNTAEVRDAGQLVIEVGIAPVKPAEFVIFRISQFNPTALAA